MQKVLVEGLPEVLQQIFQHLDCEGVRKLAAVSPTIRNTSYRALAVAEFEAQHIRVKGLFQAFQISALRDGRKSWGSESSARAFKAAIDEVQLLSAIKDDVAFMESVSSRESQGEPGTLAADRPGATVRLPTTVALHLKAALSDRERRLLALGERLVKPVVCTFNVSPTHSSAASGKCGGCSRYACLPCGDLTTCAACALAFCRECRALEACGACGTSVCSACWIDVKKERGCAQCPVFASICTACRPAAHCRVCDSHGSGGNRACDSCGQESCGKCIADSPYCQLCKEFCLW